MKGDKVFNLAGAILQQVSGILGAMGQAEASLHSGDAQASLRYLKEAIRRVKPGDRPDELEKKIDQEMAYLERLMPTERNRRMRVEAAYHEKLARETWDLLWKAGYLSGEAFKNVMPTAIDNKSGALKSPPLPGVMSSRIEAKTP